MIERGGYLQELADKAADYFGLSRELVRAMVTVESSWQPAIVSPVGAVGLTQVLPSTARWLADDDVPPLDLLDLPEGLDDSEWARLLEDPGANLVLGVGYLVRLLRRFGDARLALAAYNAGEGLVSRLLRQHGPRFEDIRSSLPPETRNHVDRVLDVMGSQGRPWLGLALGAAAVFAGALALLRRGQ